MQMFTELTVESQDRTISQITLKDFDIALRPKYHGTMNLHNAFSDRGIDFFINLSSLCGIVGTLGQSNYAAGGTFQDMFTHAQISAGGENFVTIDLPLIKATYSVTEEHTHSLDRQGVKLLPIEAALPVLDYAMSGKAFNDGNHQIAFGLNISCFIDQAQQGIAVPPLMSHLISDRRRNPTPQADQVIEQTIEDKIALASSIESANQLVLIAIRDKISSLTAIDIQDLDQDLPVVNMALDSLVATEIKNWITNTLKTAIQISDILDASSLRSLASFVTLGSNLVKFNLQQKQDDKTNDTNGEVDHHAQQNTKNGEVVLPKYPLQSLQTTLDDFLHSVGHMGNTEELHEAHLAIERFLSSGGVGKRLQERLENLSGEQNENDEVVDMYVRNKWLRGREWRPRLRNFFATLPGQDTARRPQADQATRLSLAAYQYKLSLDTGNVQQDYYNEQPLDSK